MGDIFRNKFFTVFYTLTINRKSRKIIINLTLKNIYILTLQCLSSFNVLYYINRNLTWSIILSVPTNIVIITD